jgi:hypothetical protein
MILGAVLTTENGYSATSLCNMLRKLAKGVDKVENCVPHSIFVRLDELDRQLEDKLVKRADAAWKLEAQKVWTEFDSIFKLSQTPEMKPKLSTDDAFYVKMNLQTVYVNLFTPAYEDM